MKGWNKSIWTLKFILFYEKYLTMKQKLIQIKTNLQAGLLNRGRLVGANKRRSLREGDIVVTIGLYENWTVFCVFWLDKCEGWKQYKTSRTRQSPPRYFFQINPAAADKNN